MNIMDLKDIFEKAKAASRSLAGVSPDRISSMLLDLADRTENSADEIIAANRSDLDRMQSDSPMYDRLRLDRTRIAAIAADIRNVASLPSPLGQVSYDYRRPDGVEIKRVSVPFGVIGIIYEARPNVSFDVFSLCIKSGNVCILKGGSDAYSSNSAIVSVIRRCLVEAGIDKNTVTLLPPGHDSSMALLSAEGMVDLVIPRGGKALIDFVRKNARVPVIETGAGVCHTYFDRSGDIEKGKAVITNAKTRRVSVCNALDCLIIHRDRLADLPELCSRLAEKNVVIYADMPAYAVLEGHYPGELLMKADEESYGTEFLSLKMALRTVDDIYGALDHIARYSSKHSEAIISEDSAAIDIFLESVDAACVYANVSTAFTDGAQFGFGAEVGISTQKLHARGPMGLRELTTYKYIITGNGQTRP